MIIGLNINNCSINKHFAIDTTIKISDNTCHLIHPAYKFLFLSNSNLPTHLTALEYWYPALQLQT